ncbi:MAG: hypothetical protein JRE70_21195 [Deltaproteobacteria bacterium]|nr:hypothetical protein [Deltaproteobacteria bacterium]
MTRMPSVGVVMLLMAFTFVGLGAPFDASSDASSRPERIRPDESYYSTELAEPTHQGLVRALGGEKNYEEVYQLYTYYEIVYDEEERVILFREYKRGDVIRSEDYRYDDSGSLTIRIVRQPGKEDEVTVVGAVGSKPAPEHQSH